MYKMYFSGCKISVLQVFPVQFSVWPNSTDPFCGLLILLDSIVKGWKLHQGKTHFFLKVQS